MMFDPEDTIVAIASAPGIGARAIIRCSGAHAWSVVAELFRGTIQTRPPKRHLDIGFVTLPGLHSELPADRYFCPSPHSYTGQDTVELHVINVPPLVDALIRELLNRGARAAQPGEFTLRAFLAGKKDLPQAEAVLGVIEASTSADLQHALKQLAGGISHPLQGLRDDLLNLLADIEAGLDFSEEDITFVGERDMLLRIGKGLAQLTLLQKQLDERSVTDPVFRVVLAGEPNAGKSSLFNALIETTEALVSPQAGTTRDYLTHRSQIEGLLIEWIDTPGWQSVHDVIEEQAQQLGREKAQQAALVLLCVPVNDPIPEFPLADRPEQVLLVRTKADEAPLPPGVLGTSILTGRGIADLRATVLQYARSARTTPLAPSLSRCRHHVDRALDHLRKLHSFVLFGEDAELLAMELRLGLDQIGELAGAIYTDDLLDRIFTRFCIGK